MNKKTNMLSTSELFFILVGCIIGMGVTSLPASVVAVAKQDGWISTIIGGIYPLYIVLVGGIIIRKYPESNIMNLSRAFLGNIIGNILNLLFMFQFLFYVIAVISSAGFQLRAYSIYFMPYFKIVIVFVAIACYATNKGLKVLARFSTITFGLLCIVFIPSFIIFKYASIINVKPFLGAGIPKILEGSINSAFEYGNMELLLIIYPYVQEKKDIVKTALISTLVIVTIGTWITFTSIYFSGPDLIEKQLWPFSFIAQSFKIPVINNFRYIDILIWIIVAFKTSSIEFYASTKVFNNITKMKTKTICFILAPIIFIFPLFIGNEVIRREIVGKLIPWATLFNIGYVTLIAVLTLFMDKSKLISKKGAKHINEKI